MSEIKKSKLFDRVYQKIVDRRERIKSGKINCIPWGLPRFEEESPGIEKGKFYLISANSKVGKDPFRYLYQNFATHISNDMM